MVACNAIVICEQDTCSLHSLENGGGAPASNENDEHHAITPRLQELPIKTRSLLPMMLRREKFRYICHLSTVSYPKEDNVDKEKRHFSD